MTNVAVYRQCFEKVFHTKEIEDLRYKNSPFWDSVGHITLIAELEDAFGISIEPEDMMSMLSFYDGIDILSEKYNIEF